jgi:hypothetical protein
MPKDRISGMIGQILGRYLIVEEIATGGMVCCIAPMMNSKTATLRSRFSRRATRR